MGTINRIKNSDLILLSCGGGLRKLGIKHKLIHRATLSDVTKALDEGKAVILRYNWNRKFGHYVFIDRHTKKFVRAWNHLFGNKTPIISKDKLLHEPTM